MSVSLSGRAPALTSASTSTNTIVRLTFSGSSTLGGSLIDGNYVLNVLANTFNFAGSQLDGNGDSTAGDNYASPAGLIRRKFGDADGDGDVDIADFVNFRSALASTDPAKLAIFDYEGDGDIDNADFSQFRLRFGT